MSYHDIDAGGPARMRWSTAADAAGLADLHGATWRYAYAGIIPGLTLERMIARRGRTWWARMHERGFRDAGRRDRRHRHRLRDPRARARGVAADR